MLPFGWSSSSEHTNNILKLNNKDFEFKNPDNVPETLDFATNELRSYKVASMFYELDKSSGPPWNWYRHRESVSSLAAVELDARDSINKWCGFFENSKGTWKSSAEYCKSKGNEGICNNRWYEEN